MKTEDNVFALKKGVRFLYSPQRVEELYKKHEDENTKIMDKAVDDYIDMVNKHPELAEIKHDSFDTPYFQEKWIVKKDTIYSAIEAVKNGLEYAEEALEQHELEQNEKTSSITRKDRIWTQQMEKDIEQMKIALEMLRKEPTK